MAWRRQRPRAIATVALLAAEVIAKPLEQEKPVPSGVRAALARSRFMRAARTADERLAGAPEGARQTAR